MKKQIVAEYVVDVLQKYGVTDAFGLPGGVVLELMYAINRREGITAHLSYHEQAAGFAASGFAQASGKLCVAYSTRGPGFTNMMTAIADAYCDSTPVLFITAHSSSFNPHMRQLSNQEIDTCAMVSNITKFAKRIDTVEDLMSSFEKACFIATNRRRGPVFIDMATSLWKKEIEFEENGGNISKCDVDDQSDSAIKDIVCSIKKAKRPVFLIGDGITQARVNESLKLIVDKVQIPVLSSRYAHSNLANSAYYYGYIGAFGPRYSNFILAKADLIVSLGNRLNFPLNSKTYHNLPYQTRFLRVDIDDSEFLRDIPNSTVYKADLRKLLPLLTETSEDFGNHVDWLGVCGVLKEQLDKEDPNSVEPELEKILSYMNDSSVLLGDVGSHEFWLSHACVRTKYSGRAMYSQSFATLGSAMVKSIGAYYALKRPILCFIGDQGLQMNIQELQFISQHKLPILIVVMNNKVSGMIRDKETKAYQGNYLHSTANSGYLLPNLRLVAAGYGIEYSNYSELSDQEIKNIVQNLSSPHILEMEIEEGLMLTPYLPLGNLPQDMMPRLESEKYEYLNYL